MPYFFSMCFSLCWGFQCLFWLLKRMCIKIWQIFSVADCGGRYIREVILRRELCHKKQKRTTFGVFLHHQTCEVDIIGLSIIAPIKKTVNCWWGSMTSESLFIVFRKWPIRFVFFAFNKVSLQLTDLKT